MQTDVSSCVDLPTRGHMGSVSVSHALSGHFVGVQLPSGAHVLYKFFFLCPDIN